MFHDAVDDAAVPEGGGATLPTAAPDTPKLASLSPPPPPPPLFVRASIVGSAEHVEALGVASARRVADAAARLAGANLAAPPAEEAAAGAPHSHNPALRLLRALRRFTASTDLSKVTFLPITAFAPFTVRSPQSAVQACSSY